MKESPDCFRFIEKSILFLAPFFIGLLALTQGQDVNWDLLNYHYYTGYAFWTGSWQKDMMPAGIQSLLEPLYNIFIYLLIHNLPPIAVGFILGTLDGLAFIFLFLIAGLFIDKRIERASYRLAFKTLVALSGLYVPNFLSQLGNTNGDVLTGLFVLSGLTIVLHRMGDESSSGWIWGGLLMGMGVGLKLTNGVYVLGMAIAVALSMGINKTNLKRLISFLSGSGAGFAVTGGYWFWILYRRFGNPFFPYYNTLFHSPYGFSADSHDYRWFPSSVTEWIFFPFYFTKQHQIAELSIENYSFMFIYVLIVLVFLKLVISRVFPEEQIKEDSDKIVPLNEKLFLIFFVASFIVWEVTFSYYRYLSPLEGLAPILIFILLRYFLVRGAVIVTLSLLLFNAINPHYPDWGRIPWGKSYFQMEGIKKGLPKEALVLVGAKPLAFVIPELPEGFRYFTIGNLGGIASPLWSEKIHVRVQKSQEPLYLLTDKDALSVNQKSLNAFGVKIDRSSCISLKNRARVGIRLCRLKKIPNLEGKRIDPSLEDKMISRFKR